ncbi:MAG: hypothetical protein DRJ52_10280 [Thermoprotei archaeon]|nr:MAG: hypothetical protein DRJ52_10280 [Thermoprotei archaeon]RLF00927.1 MAG: hypothetical protein DRJ63_00775 [Thermoprotei archaeon]
MSKPKDPIKEFEDKMIKEGKSLSFIKRCKRRLRDVVEVSKTMWIVRGRASLGDWYSMYIVVYDENRGKFRCSCQSLERHYSGRRRKSMCTHVGAVILYSMVSKSDSD